jgi:hypothetical protein
MGARYYESSSGRFLSPDPYGHAASLSLYDYAGGDPINFVDPTGRLQVEQQSQGATQDSGFRFYEHPGVGQGGSNALVNVVEAERSRSMAMGAFFTNRTAAFTIGDAATSTMPKEVWNQYYGSYLQRTDAFMWMGYMAGGLEGALANENTTLTLFGVALGGLAAPVAAEGIIAGGLVAGNGVMGAATWTMTQANNIRAVGVSVYLMSRQPGAYQAFNQFAEEGMALVSGYDGPSLSPVGFADDVISGVRRSLNSVGDVASTGGSGFAQASRRWTALDAYEASNIPASQIDSHLKGIDFSKPVTMRVLNPGKIVTQWQKPGRPVGNYFSDPGSPPGTLGFDVTGRTPTNYTPRSPATVLQSTAADMPDWNGSGRIFTGGSQQYFTVDPGKFIQIP